MPTNTDKYGLIKPNQDDFYNIDDFNANADTVDAALDNKVDKVAGKGLSTNDYSNVEKSKVATIDNKVDKITGKGLSTNDFDNASKNLLESTHTALKNGTAIPFVTLTSSNGYNFVGNMPGVPFTVGMLIVAFSENTTSLTEGRTISIKINDTNGDLVRVPDTGQLTYNYQFGEGVGIFLQGPQLLQLIKDETSYFGNLKWMLVSHPQINLNDKNATGGILPITHGGVGTNWSWLSNNDKGLVSINKTSNVLEYTYTPKSSYTNSFLTQGSNGDPTWSRPSDAAKKIMGEESGNWTAKLQSASGVEISCYDIMTAKYYISGRFVHVTFDIRVTNLNSAPTSSELLLTGLPEPAVAPYTSYKPIVGTIGWKGINTMVTGKLGGIIATHYNSPDTSIKFKYVNMESTVGDRFPLMVGSLSVNSELSGSFIYLKAVQ